MRDVMESMLGPAILCALFLLLTRKRNFSWKTQVAIVATLLVPFLLLVSREWRSAHNMDWTLGGSWWMAVGIGLACVAFIAIRLRSVAVFLLMSGAVLTSSLSLRSPLIANAIRNGYGERLRIGLHIALYACLIASLAVIARQKESK